MTFISFNKPDINFKLVRNSLKPKDEFGVELAIKSFFSKMTKKKHIIITDSCRTSLYLAHKFSSTKSRLVHVSPLTCRSAILPIIAANKDPVFTEVDKDTLLMDELFLDKNLKENSGSLQVISLGGNMNNMEKIKRICKEKNLILIEDCAQSFGSSYKGSFSGSFGDISCFSLSKNLYSFGGGILALDDSKIFSKINDFYSKVHKQSYLSSFYKIVKYLLDTSSNNVLSASLYKYLQKLSITNKSSNISNFNKLKRPNSITINSIYFQLRRFKEMERQRMKNAKYLIKNLPSNGFFSEQRITPNTKSSFVRLYLNSKVSSKNINLESNNLDIQFRHLKSRYGCLIQDDFIKDKTISKYGKTSLSKNYFSIHGNLISVPLSSKMSNEDKNVIINFLKNKSNEYNN